MAKEWTRLQVIGATSVTCLFLLPLFYASFFASNGNPFADSWKDHLSSWRGKNGATKIDRGEEEKEPLEFLLRRLVRGEDRTQLEATGFSCHSDLHSEVCVSNKPVRIDNHAMTVYIPSNETETAPQMKRMVQPYARKEDDTAMKAVTPVQILHTNISPPACHFTHDVPAVIFSSGGFTGNIFHEFNEIIIPLFITCHHFKSHLKFVITDFKPWWVRKFNRILTHLSSYDVINPTRDGNVHCFPGAVIGLKYHDNLAFNATDIPGGYSMFDFKQFLKKAYNLKLTKVLKIEKPVLMLLSRNESRRFLNEDEMVGMMEELGFRVIVTMANMTSDLDKFSNVVNSCSVLVGAHGAGLTNGVFLPAGAVMVQVVPLGLDWASATYYGGSAGEMGVQYLEYKIEPEESSLIDSYGRDHPVITDPASIFLKGYYAARAMYVDGQDLKVNLVRFRETLVEAIKLLGYSPLLN
ncbi:hypothetical protein L1049_001367 [Liquidambar formosana]|uniref:Glycosyltransferase 61 catalytic domain-containing protein n=1 Tax=Liquidambar formosana TaxID=63359 RepID=A0AAP0NC97_LIQFO